jgi:HD-like signal output (HDOD) protein
MPEAAQEAKKSILFVDDEAKVLDGLRRMLRPKRKQWRMAFVNSGQEALERLAEGPFDVVVADMRMPGMDGGDLLAEVRASYPGTVRLILSGHADFDSVKKTIRPAHKFLSKPFPKEDFIAVIETIFFLQRLIAHEDLRESITGLDTLPSRPITYSLLVEALQSEDAKRIGEAFSYDAGMAANILKVALNTFLGVSAEFPWLNDCANMIGLDTMRRLILSERWFTHYHSFNLPEFSLDDLWQHSRRTAEYAWVIATLESGEPLFAKQCYIAGLLHDVGKAVMAYTLNEQYRKVLDLIPQRGWSIDAAEKEVFRVTHAPVGGYLMGLWGLPLPVVEAIAFHNRVGPFASRGFCVMSAVHVANFFDHRFLSLNREGCDSRLDRGYLEEIGRLERLEAWEKGCLKWRRKQRKEAEQLLPASDRRV